MNEIPLRDPLLLIIACSQRKAAGLVRGDAWHIYDGQLFRILKNVRRDHPWRDDELHILIISARYGVLKPGRVIATYDRRLTSSEDHRTRVSWGLQLKREIAGAQYRAIHVNLGRLYLGTLPDIAELFPGMPVDRATGGIGARNAQTRRWVLEQLGVPPVSI